MLFTTASAWRRNSSATTLMLATSAASLPMIEIVYYVGRMTYEDVSVLLNAAPKVVWGNGGYVKFVFIGGNTDDLKRQAWDLGIWDKCYFTGFMLTLWINSNHC